MRASRLRFNFAFCLATVAFVSGCTGGSPAFTVLDQGAIPQPLFAGQTQKSITRATSVETTSILGQCDARVRAIRVNFRGSGTATGGLDLISAGPPTLACSSGGTFSFTLKSLADLVGQPIANQTYQIELRSDTAGGVSSPSLLLVTYVREGDERWRLSSGGTPLATTGGSFRADVRVTNLVGTGDTGADSSKGTARSTNFIFKRGRAAR